MINNQSPFSLLPAALVGEMMTRSQDVGKLLLSHIREITYNREDIRRQLSEIGLLKDMSGLPDVPPPTTVGVDGAQVVDRLLGTDLVTCAAIAVEGLTPLAEACYSSKPSYKLYVLPEPHNANTGTVSRGILWELEIVLAVSLPHDIVLINGSMFDPFLYVNAAITKSRGKTNSGLAKELVSNWEEFLVTYNEALSSTSTDKLWVGIPKYSSKREIGSQLEWLARYEDRAILTSILQPGEYTFPVPCEQSQDLSHIGVDENSFRLTSSQKLLHQATIDKIGNLHVCYFRPDKHTPAIRLEIPKSLTSNDDKLSALLQAVRLQCSSPGITEPFPLYMANKMVKDIASAIPTFRQTATREITNGFDEGIQEIFFSTHKYKTENQII